MQHYYYSFANGKKNKIIATFFSSHVNEHLLLVTNVSSIACSKNSFPFQPHTLISQTCKFVSITRTVYLSFTTYTVLSGLFAFSIKLTKESIVILNYICSEQPLVICTLMGGYYKDCIAAKSK